MTCRIFLVFLVAVISNFADAKTQAKPKDVFQLCKRNDPGLSMCVYKAMKDNIGNLVAGIPELHLNPTDPFLGEKIEKKTEELTFTLTNLNLTGGRDVVIYSDNFNVEGDFSWINYTASCEQLNLESDYTLERPGKPTKTGKAIFTLGEVTMNVAIGFEFYDKDGAEYFKCNNFLLVMVPKDSKTHLGGITDELDEDLDSIFGNSQIFFGVMLTNGLQNEFKEYVNRAILKHPTKDWFLD